MKIPEGVGEIYNLSKEEMMNGDRFLKCWEIYLLDKIAVNASYIDTELTNIKRELEQIKEGMPSL